MKKLTFLLCALVCAGALSAQTYYITGSSTTLFGASWNPAKMALDAQADGTYAKTFTTCVIGKEYQFKITNGDWDNDTGGKTWGFSDLTSVPEGVTGITEGTGKNNIVCTTYDANMTVVFDPAKEGKITLTGTFTNGSGADPGTTTYYMKHSWNGGDWTWKELAANGDGTYSIRDIYGGSGCNWNTQAKDDNSKWISNPTLLGSPAKGDSAVFTLDPTAGDKAITITKIGATGGEGGDPDPDPEPDPEPGHIVIKVQIPDNLTAWEYTVEPYVYSWATGAEGKFAAQPMSLVDGWYTHTFDVAVANFIIVNGNDWPEGTSRQSVNMENVTADACYIMGNGEEIKEDDGSSWKKTLTATECETTALQAVTVADIYARDGRIYGAEGMRIYTVSGMDVTDQNGQLNGIYIVKAQTGVYKIAVK